MAFAVAGIGWLVVVPAVAGFALGRWLDGRYGTGIRFAAGLGLLGLVIGCSSAWRRVARQGENDQRGQGA
jgi:ATP synthase protein I